MFFSAVVNSLSFAASARKNVPPTPLVPTSSGKGPDVTTTSSSRRLKLPIKRKLDKTASAQPASAKKQKEAEGKGKRVVKFPNYRSNIGSIFKLLKTLRLTNKHKAELRKTPFWAIIETLSLPDFKPASCRCYNKIVAEIVRLYKRQNNSFKIGNEYVKLRKGDVRLIFGIEGGKKNSNSKDFQ